MRKVLLGGGTALAVVSVFVAGYFIGRARLSSAWSDRPSIVSDSDVAKMRVEGADMPPRAGSKVLNPMPLERSRAVLGEYVAKDPVRVTVGSLGRGDDGAEISFVVSSSMDCEITELEGVLYGFEASGKSTAVNKRNEHFAGFRSTEKIAPRAKKQKISFEHKNAGVASIVLAHVDHAVCANGTSWHRP